MLNYQRAYKISFWGQPCAFNIDVTVIQSNWLPFLSHWKYPVVQSHQTSSLIDMKSEMKQNFTRSDLSIEWFLLISDEHLISMNIHESMNTRIDIYSIYPVYIHDPFAKTLFSYVFMGTFYLMIQDVHFSAIFTIQIQETWYTREVSASRCAISIAWQPVDDPSTTQVSDIQMNMLVFRIRVEEQWSFRTEQAELEI